ncbi:MAG: hypothetical protein WKF56_05495 [Candidatus Limnocylindrales bacterium]
MKRLFAALLVALLLAAVVGPAVVAARSRPVPRVVIVVGPSGEATDRYRAEARSAAALARRYTKDVTEIYSPDATWPAVRRALQGASLVVYMGHGNGWPSKYRDRLFRPTQNGFGLNPTPNGNDATHQYFGEARIASSVKLAPNAIVLLNHLCYASGNSEPGVPEGTLAMARQRVDNFAAGFIQAGAGAVVAEAYTSPNYFLSTVLDGHRSIEAAWRNAPSRNGHVFGFKSVRSKGYFAQMDPERGSSGFSRSIVLKAGLASSDVIRGARGSGRSDRPASAPGADSSTPEGLLTQEPTPPPIPSLVTAGMKLALPKIEGATIAAGKVKLRLPYKIKQRSDLPKGLEASIRWDPLEITGLDPANEVTPTDGPPSGDTSEATDAAPAVGASSDPAAPTTGAGRASDSTSAPAAVEEPATEDPKPVEPPSLGLVTPERLGDVIAPVRVKIARKSRAFMMELPAAPGRYRLTITLHDAEGVMYDPATQAMLPSLIVRITNELDAEIIAPARIELEAGAATTVPLWAANLGKQPWGHAAIRNVKDPERSTPATAARLTGQWISLGAFDDAAQAAASAAAVEPKTLPWALAPREMVPVNLDLAAPTVPGDYLLVLDILTPERGSITASGVEATIIRVRVAKPVAVRIPVTADPN